MYRREPKISSALKSGEVYSYNRDDLAIWLLVAAMTLIFALNIFYATTDISFDELLTALGYQDGVVALLR
ncbi:hypothetical protein [Gluconobacter wancherniae]|uniref:Uncharacterized protein n=1 Tax=Gluconobacter wancherniae NBRC 103581 TaxID=656744 RepID=A0A511B8E3_9PROT|nr:hypothetical protein [Gluconobacter wancherniae]MBF0854085.1 hypothetical protein [Gluconobacter wancherniae]MBS1062471.1 hypothetical protein [Gluconobacter wancherniae]MBS1088787.1 hypothetical protein [Gluconobacter wancherniae]MBS1095473.1 hypothetical protein [Gluconobacter wancherniae]GBD57141.1 hypothetical protein NBRC103581_01725 [Gluconobacter wancherniae NBRC 103581]